MDDEDAHESWLRVKARIATLPRGAGREEAWLKEKLKTTASRVHNWTTRGIPAQAAVQVAAAIGWTVAQVLGVKDPDDPWPFETVERARWDALSERGRAMVEIKVDQELARLEALSEKLQDQDAA